MKQTGKRRAGKPHAAFDVAGAGNVAMVAGLRSIAKAMELPPAPAVRAPALDPTCESSGTLGYSDTAYLREEETGGRTTGDSACQAQSANGLVCSHALFYAIDRF
jgi:hypothetical protein